MNLFGFTILRNGVKYDYPFLESLRSLCGLCDEVYLALGKSEDGTEKLLAEFKNLVIIPTVWDEEMRKSGLILSVQTNIALEALRAKHPNGWGIYLQADEVLHEGDFARIRADAAAAEKAGCDAISFRYLHFWQSYHQIAIDRRWYPQEIRAVRLNSEARSYGDAQSFERVKKRFESEAVIYHYGHVREPAAYEKKKADFGRWWHSDEELKRVLAKGARRDRLERTIPYFGPQPGFMKSKIGQSFEPVAGKKILVFGRPENFAAISEKVKGELEWTTSVSKILSAGPKQTVLLEPLPIWASVLSPLFSSIPAKMHSPQAREWSPEFRAMLRLSEKGIYVQ